LRDVHRYRNAQIEFEEEVTDVLLAAVEQYDFEQNVEARSRLSWEQKWSENKTLHGEPLDDLYVPTIGKEISSSEYTSIVQELDTGITSDPAALKAARSTHPTSKMFTERRKALIGEKQQREEEDQNKSIPPVARRGGGARRKNRRYNLGVALRPIHRFIPSVPLRDRARKPIPRDWIPSGGRKRGVRA
jgi:hypothetical protein